MRRTKIVVTLGPATNTHQRIAELIEAGMNVARLNFSHGTHADHAASLVMVRAAAAELGQPIAILQDLQGPKIRTGALENGEPVELTDGQTFTITTRPVIGNRQQVHTTYDALPHDVSPGDAILISDGLLALKVHKTTDTDVLCEVINGGILREKQGINLPGVKISARAVTRKDINDLHFGLEQGVDYVAISFVRQPDDVQQVKDLIRQAGQDVPVIAKIERPEPLEALDDILAVADGVMVARGDLGVELPLEEVPVIQKHIIAAANRRAVPVITATQMLESMIHNPTPTRAEVSDVANAIIDGSDAVMLSGETSIGQYPVEAVRMMAEIIAAAEASGYCHLSQRAGDGRWLRHDVDTIPEAIGAAVSAIVSTLGVACIWVFTQSGSTARLTAQFRPGVPIIAFTPYEHVYRRMSLLWGVTPVRVPYFETDEQFWQRTLPVMIERGYARPGDTVVMTGGHPFSQHGPTNFLKIIRLEEIGSARS